MTATNLTILNQLGKVDALKGVDVTIDTKNTQLQLKTHNAVKSFFRNLFTPKQKKLAEIKLIAELLNTVITADVKDRYSVTGSKDNFDIDVAKRNVQKVMADLKAKANKLSSKKSSSTIAFNAQGALTVNADKNVANVITKIDKAAGNALNQIDRLKPRSLSSRTIDWYTSSPKDKQIYQLRKDLQTVKKDLMVVPPTHADYALIKREEVGLEYAISQLEMYVPTYKQDMENLLEDAGYNSNQISGFITLPDFDPNTPSKAAGKDSWIQAELSTASANKKKILEGLELLLDASILVKAPIDHQAKQAMARLKGARQNGGPRGRITRFGHDFNGTSNFLRNSAIVTTITAVGIAAFSIFA